MKKLSVDVAIIGAGTAGLAAYRAATKTGRHAVLIEGGTYGTTCVKVGCMPSKLLIVAANAAHEARRAKDFGVQVGEVHVDAAAVFARVRQERDHFESFVLKEVHEIPAENRLRGHARFLSNTVLQVGDDTEVQARSVVIATGARPLIPDVFKPLGDRLQTSDDIFEWSGLPKRVAVFGPGPIGLELGQALHRLGVSIHLFGEKPSISLLQDPAIQKYAAQALAEEFPLSLGVEVVNAQRQDDGIEITWKDSAGKTSTEHFDIALVATGRVPNVDQLGLEHTQVPVDKHGTPIVDPDTLQAGTTPIFVAGDANDMLPLLHVAHEHGLTAGTNAGNFPTLQAAQHVTPLSIVFCEPQLIQAGKPYSDLEADTFVTGRVSFETQGRSRIMLKNRGLLHVYIARKDGKLLGAEGMGPDAEHLAHLLAWAIQQGQTVADLLAMPFYHPTIEEALRTALRDAASKLSK
ncbi:dihydrolipoyl dehydrogenase [Pigmentiphaga aceris]|uniref:Dihydrolipoyl dehydrogenase n=1 Tax=Pigmentiphaga aceris TaxID=1940612 RepID=A0A5C0AUK7_9BURK|nr:dihydrolipoyl dehydrogenase [Pigmentiphaga aceris]QEI06109.1 dihydrolipoyl dehydrogenase [Pigmentiphaga aceris]